MNARIKRIFAVLFLAGAAPVVFGACAKNESSLFVHGCLIPTNDTCMVTSDPTAPYHSQGELDARYASEYSCDLLVGNQLVQRGDTSTLKTETSRIQLYAVDVSILDAGGEVVTYKDPKTGMVGSGEFEAPTTGFVDVGTGNVPGYGVAQVKLIDANTATALREEVDLMGIEQDVVASIIVRGRTLGGNEVESAPFDFPIRVCDGCLCVDPPGVDCTDTTTMPTANCHVGIDDPVDCRFTGGACN